MNTFAGLSVVASILLIVGGTVKVARPSTTANAVGVAAPIVRVGAAAELTVGLVACATGAVPAVALVAASYVAFAVFVAWALWREAPLATCACFGEPDSPPTLLHVLIDLALAVSAAATATTDAGRPIGQLSPAAVVGVCVVTYVTFLSLTSLPRVRAISR
jgi:hypothetical protein